MHALPGPHYFSCVRTEIAPLLPPHAARVLEVGCGAGGTLAWLKDSGRAGWVVGIELDRAAAARARGAVDQLLQGDADQLLPHLPAHSFDLILCLDVLEHLLDPWQTLQRLRGLLRPGGQLIVSLPNIRHYSVLLPLLLAGRWRYTEAGILDRSHLRFFSRDSACALVQQAGLRVRTLRPTYAWGSGDRWKDWLTLGLLRGFFSFQYLLLADAAPAPARP